MKTQAIIIGGGLAGISVARKLQQNGIEYILLEATDRIGGRVKTDIIDGFRLDYGFQVLLTAYPEAKKKLDYDKLDLKKFLPGAQLLFQNGSQGVLGDPLRDIRSLIPTIFSKAGNLKDKFLILKLRNRLAKLSIDEIFEQEEHSTVFALKNGYGFSDKMIKTFFEPFFSSIFLEKDLETSRRMFDFVFKMFGEGFAAVPNAGMEEIPKQLAQPLSERSIITNARVTGIDKQEVTINNGDAITAPNIILATEATGLVQELHKVKKKHQTTTHVHFVANEAPIARPIIALNTNKKRLVNNICTINRVAEKYAAGSKQLISLSIVGKHGMLEKELIQAIRKELSTWFGNVTQEWEHLHTRNIEYALPDQTNVLNSIDKEKYKIRPGLYACGDYQLNGSINAAIKVGSETGDLIIENN